MLNCQKVFSINIDGATNAINANILAYTVPSGKEVHVGSLLCSNENTDNAQVWIYHTSSAETLDVNRDRVSPGTLVAGNGGTGGSGGTLNYQIGMCLAPGDKIYVKSSKTSVNFIMWGEVGDI